MKLKAHELAERATDPRKKELKSMNKTITAAFEVPDNEQIITIMLADTCGIAVGTWMRIGFDSYLIIKVNQLSIVIEKHPTVIPAGMECLIIESAEEKP